MKLIYKLKLNGIYGKTGQHPIKSQAFYGKKEHIDESKFTILGKIRNDFYEGFNVERMKEETKCGKYVVLASYITAMARVALLTKYKQITDNGNEFLYCDTDSICFIEHNKQEFPDIGDDLGQWEFEDFGTASEFCSLCPKQYRICNDKGEIVKFACAGVSKQEMGLVANADYNYDLGENPKYNINKKCLKQSINGKLIVDGVFSFKKWKHFNTNPIYRKDN